MNQLALQDARSLPLFSGVDDRLIRRLLDSAAVERLSADTVLFGAGETAERLHLVLRGIVELYSGKPPRECTLLLMSKGDLFMPAATLFDEPYLNSARTLTASTLLLIPARTVRREFARSRELAINFSRALAGQFRMAARHIIDLRSCSAPERLGRFLLRLAQEADEGTHAVLPAAKGKLAARVGMSRETFSRALQTLAGHGLVVRGAQIIVRDRARIEAFCGGADLVSAGEHGLDVHAI